MPRTTTPRTVICYHCGRRFDVGGRALTTSCPGCFKRVAVNDIVVKTLESVRLQTCGRLLVQKTGRVFAQSVDAQEGVEVEGVLEANVVSGGPVRIGPKAVWKGNCRAPLSIALGGKVLSGFFDIRATPENDTVEVSQPSGSKSAG